MNPRAGKASVIVFIALMIGCASPPPPANAPSQVQVSFNFNPPGGSRKGIERGAVSGVPQHVGFFYSVNPDCSSDGLVQTRLSTPPTHGLVAFVEAQGYTGFPSGSPGYECNKKKSPGIEVVYTSAPGFVGTDEFTVQGIGPHGKYMETVYTVKVLAPVSKQ
jgi:hypothetical protein